MGAKVDESGAICHVCNLRRTDKCCHKDLSKSQTLAKLKPARPRERLRHIDDAQHSGFW